MLSVLSVSDAPCECHCLGGAKLPTYDLSNDDDYKYGRPKQSFDKTNTPKTRVLKIIFNSYTILILCWASPKPELRYYYVLET